MSETPEQRSDRYDEKLLAVAADAYVPTRRVLWVAAVAVIVVVTLQFMVLVRIALDNRSVLRTTVPSLAEKDRRIAQQDKTLQQQQYVLTKQAVPVILYMAARLKALGEQPPTAILDPDSPPFTPPDGR